MNTNESREHKMNTNESMHSWFPYCIDPSEFARVSTLKEFLGILKKQSNSIEAMVPYREDIRNGGTDAINPAIRWPRYFGGGVEALAEPFFDLFGAEYNLHGYRSQDDILEDLEDTGYDARAMTSKQIIHLGKHKKVSKPGNTIYVQVKGSLNPTKEFTTNDGSRIMNFYGNAKGLSCLMNEGYSARFILFTTAKGLHYKLDKNTHKEIEVIGYKKICKKVDGNVHFWNVFRERLGIPALPINPPQDGESQLRDILLEREAAAEAAGIG